MSSFLTQAELDAIDRLQNYYNVQSYNAVSNPGGLTNDGHRVNLEPMMGDMATTATAMVSLTEDADSLAGSAATSATNAETAATGAANAQTAAIMAQGGAELARQQAETIAAGAAQAVQDAAALAGSGDFTGDVAVDGDVITEGGAVDDILFITSATTLGTRLRQVVDGGLQCTLGPDTVIGRKWQMAGNWESTVNPGDQAVTIAASGADSFIASQDRERVISTDLIIDDDGFHELVRVSSNLLVVE